MSRITLRSASTTSSLEQVTKQLNKLVEVLKIVELEESAVRRELVLIKVRPTPDPQPDHRDRPVVPRQDCRRADDSLTIEATGSPDKLDALLEMLKPYGIRELVQSGLVALGRGSKSLTDRAIDRPDPHPRAAMTTWH